MGEDVVEKGCLYLSGSTITWILGAALGGGIGFVLLKNPIVSFIAAIVSGLIYRWWWRSMVRTKRKPIRHLLLFILMAIALMAGILFIGA